MTRRTHRPLSLAVWCWALALSIVVALRAQDSWMGVERIVAVGDIHGDYGQLVRALRSAGVIDRQGNWIARKTHLVQLGDVVDRGFDSRKAMDLLVRLENQAREQGGYVHALIGNHEAMNVYGDLHYVTSGEFAAFRNDDPGDAVEILYGQHIQELRTTSREKLPIFDDEYRRRWESRFPSGFFAHRFQFGPRGQYGKWIRGHNTVVRINDSIFLHGGIGPKYAAFSISQLNQRVRAELQDLTKLRDRMVIDPDGPLWYRGLALDEEARLERHVRTLLGRHEASRIVIGHTVTEGTVMPRFGGRVLLIDVGLTRFYGSRLACLVVENGKAYTLHRGKRLEMPSDSDKGSASLLDTGCGASTSCLPWEGSSTTRSARSRTSASSRSRALTPSRSRSGGSRKSLWHRTTIGRSFSSITPCTRQATGTARTSACAKCSSRSS